MYVNWNDASILKKLKLSVAWILLGLNIKETGIFEQTCSHLTRVNQHILNNTVHDRYFELRLDEKHKHVDVVSRCNSEDIIAVQQFVFQLLL